LAAALGNAGLAAWLPLSWRARLQPGESVLVLGATGTSGLIAVAAARALGAGRIVAVGRNPERLERALAAGADAVVQLEDCEDLDARYQAALEGPADIVVDYLNGPPAMAALKVMATGGRMVQLSSTLSQSIEVPAMLARKHSLTVMGFAYYHAPRADQEAAYAALCKAAVNNLIELDHAVTPLDSFKEAWQRQKEGSPVRQVIVP
jgi:NADPH2:quinone reductase